MSAIGKLLATGLGLFVAVSWANGAGIEIIGTNPPEQPSAADIPAAQRTLDRSEAFLAAHTGAPEERRALVVGLPKQASEEGAVAATDGISVAAEGWVVVAWARMDQDPGLDGWDLNAARVGLHEQGHSEDDVPGNPQDEGLRDAVALDLVPAFTYAQTGRKAPGYGDAAEAGYPAWVTRVRALAARAVCSRPRGYAARAWVARVSTLPRPDRRAAFAAAEAHVCGVRP